MKIIEHKKRPPLLEVHMTFDPMTVWLTSTTEMKIERGDRLDKIARIASERLGLPARDARQLTAYWFALGERAAADLYPNPWTSFELRTKKGRRYLSKKSLAHQVSK